MVTRARSFSYFFDGPRGGVIVVVETLMGTPKPINRPRREHGLYTRKASIRRLIKVLACLPQETNIQLGWDGWSVTVFDDPPKNYCLSNTTKENENSSTDQESTV